MDTMESRGGEVYCLGDDLSYMAGKSGEKTVHIYARIECQQSLINGMGEATGQAKEKRIAEPRGGSPR